VRKLSLIVTKSIINLSSVIQFYDLPLELLDVILQKSYLRWILNSSKEQRDEEVIRSLISVDICFNKRITKQRFKKVIWRYLKGEMSSKYYCKIYLGLARPQWFT